MLKTTSVLLFSLITSVAMAQTELMKQLEQADDSTVQYAAATFKGTRIINGHSIETVGSNNMDFIISHRFGAINSGASNFFGLDQSQIRLALEYGLTDRLMVGLGRSSYQKTIDVFVKYRLLRQSSGLRNMPVSVTLFASDAHNASTSTPDLPFYTITQRQTYTFQALIARKFNEKLSLQLTPTVMHRNLAEKSHWTQTMCMRWAWVGATSLPSGPHSMPSTGTHPRPSAAPHNATRNTPIHSRLASTSRPAGTYSSST